MIADPEAFILANTALSTPPLLPELRHHAATEVTPLWLLTEERMADNRLPPPFWAFAWAGGQALARHLLDRPELVRGKRVLSVACGGGLEAIAAARAGAAQTIANDIDTLALAACRLNAAANGVFVERLEGDLLAGDPPYADVFLAGDVCYERPMAERMVAWLRRAAASGALALLGDPGRAYLPRDGLEECGTYAVTTTRELEESEMRMACVWRVAP